MKFTDQSTIAAISTPLSSGAISIVRLSGPKAIEIADKVFVASRSSRPSSFTPRMLMLGRFEAADFTEQCLCVVFKAPNSFTGEDMVEFQCHGGVFITKSILSALISCGARMATPGEFTKRAFISGKMSLSGAEGMMDMINAESAAEVRAGYSLLSGELAKLAQRAQGELIDIMSDIEVSLDYPEEDIEETTKENVSTRLEKIKEDIDKVLASHTSGKIIKEGVRVAILGQPNVGKSSILNALVGDQKAIVTPIAGTTRDIVEAQVSIDGLKFNLFDTAGIRAATDEVEKIGVDRAKSLITSADILLLVTDGDQPLDPSLEPLRKKENVIVVRNKSDLGAAKAKSGELLLSAKTGQGLSELKRRLYQLATKQQQPSGLILTNERHYSAMSRASSHLAEALASLGEFSLDLATIDLRLAYSALGEITGNTSGEDIIDAIFSKFCLGK